MNSNTTENCYPKIYILKNVINESHKQLDFLPDLSKFIGVKKLLCSDNNIYELPRFPRSFHTLLILNCSYNKLHKLPELPLSLRELDCSYNTLSNLPELPIGLHHLDCSSNNLLCIPWLNKNLELLNCSRNIHLITIPTLNDKLKSLICFRCDLYTLPPLKNIERLFCEHNSLHNLPELPKRLIYLDCSYNRLDYLPALNNCLLTIECSNNTLKSIPPLPDSMDYVDCSRNHLTELPALNRNLRHLICSYNQLRQLPVLNDNLEYINCSDNDLTHLPVLTHKIHELICNYNNISMLPLLNPSLRNIIFDKNPIYTILYNDELSYFDVRFNFIFQMDGEEYNDFLSEITDETHLLRQKVKTLHDFRFLFYSLKYKTVLRNFLWDKIRRPKIEAKYHPDNLQKLLDSMNEEDDLLEIVANW